MELALMVLDPGDGRGEGLREAARLGWRRGLLPACEALLPPGPARRPRDLSRRLGGVPTVIPRLEAAGRVRRVAPASCREIAEFDLDVLLSFWSGALEGAILDVPGHGVWAFHAGGEELGLGAPPGFREVLEGAPVTRASLRRLTGRGEGVVLRRGRFGTRPHSFRATRDDVLLGAAHWPASVCAQIRAGHEDFPEEASSATVVPARAPSSGEALRCWIRCGRNLLGESFRYLFRHERWVVGVLSHPPERLLEGGVVRGVRWLPEASRGEFLADPMPVEGEGSIRVLCELFSYREDRGRIVGFDLRRGDGNGPASATALRPLFDGYRHMSYPYTFRHDGRWYCTPETYLDRKVDLHVADGPAGRWRRAGTLLSDVAAVDPTVFRHEGRWWLACTDFDHDRYRDLFLWYADDPTGPWRPHALNPVKTDVRSARPAGTPFRARGRLYRPAQDCSRGYGRRVVLNRVLRLSPTEFAEEEAAVLEPDPAGPYPDGLHTVAAAGDVTLVDGKREVFEPWGLWHRLRRTARQILRRG